jgi:signal peptidase I
LNRWIKFSVVAVCYLLWVIWLGNFWWLLGLIVIFDLYITKKVKWAFWKKKYEKGEKRNVWLDWLDAIIFALVAATFVKSFFFEAYMIPTSSMENTLMTGDYLFVGKLKYGPVRPRNPLTVPLTHNVIFGKESYSRVIEKPYKRMAGFKKNRSE